MSKRVEAKAEGMNVQSPRLKVCNSGLIWGIRQLYMVARLLFMNATSVTDRRPCFWTQGLEHDSIIAANFAPCTGGCAAQHEARERRIKGAAMIVKPEKERTYPILRGKIMKRRLGSIKHVIIYLFGGRWTQSLNILQQICPSPSALRFKVRWEGLRGGLGVSGERFFYQHATGAWADALPFGSLLHAVDAAQPGTRKKQKKQKKKERQGKKRTGKSKLARYQMECC